MCPDLRWGVFWPKGILSPPRVADLEEVTYSSLSPDEETTVLFSWLLTVALQGADPSSRGMVGAKDWRGPLVRFAISGRSWSKGEQTQL